MTRLASIVFAVALALSPAAVRAQNSPATAPMVVDGNNPGDGSNTLPESGGIGTDTNRLPSGWHRYVPASPTGWAALMLIVAAVMSIVWRPSD